MKTKRIILGSILAFACFVCAFFGFSQMAKKDGFNGTYDGVFIAYAESSGAVGEVKSLTSVNQDYLLLATAINADVADYKEVGYVITESQTGESIYSSSNYYTGITVRTTAGIKTYEMADIFDDISKTQGMIVVEIAYDPTLIYTIRPYMIATDDTETTIDALIKDPVAPRTLVSISATAPNKSQYKVGEAFDPTGMVVTANYTAEPFTEIITDYDYSTAQLTPEDNAGFVVEYEGKTANVPITVDYELFSCYNGWMTPSSSVTNSFFLKKDGRTDLGTYAVNATYAHSFKAGAKMRFYYYSDTEATAKLSFCAASGNTISTAKQFAINVYQLINVTDDVNTLTPTALTIPETNTFGYNDGLEGVLEWTDFSTKTYVGDISLQTGWTVIEVCVLASKTADFNFRSMVLNYKDYSVLTHENLQHVSAVAADCDNAGNIEYWYCPDCDRYYSDANCTTRIAQKDTVVEGGHAFTNDWTFVAPTKTIYAVGEEIDTTGMSLTRNCSRCGVVDATDKVVLSANVANKAAAYCNSTIVATYLDNQFTFDITVYSATDKINTCYVGWMVPAFLTTSGIKNNASYFVKKDTVNTNTHEDNDLYGKMGWSVDASKVKSFNNGEHLRIYFYVEQDTTAKFALSSATANSGAFANHYKITMATADENEKPDTFSEVSIYDDAMVSGGWVASEVIVADLDLKAGWNVIDVECINVYDHDVYYATLYLN